MAELLPVLTIIWYSFEWSLRILAVFVVPRKRKPSAGMAWLMFIFLIPPIGWMLFLIIGNTKLPLARRQAQQRVNSYMKDRAEKNRAVFTDLIGTVPVQYSEVATLAEELTQATVLIGAKAQALTHYQQTIDGIVDDINAATETVYVEYYILALDTTTEPLFVALEQAVKRGVDVRVLYDAYGSRKYPQYRQMRERLTAAGIRHEKMLPMQWPGKSYMRPDLRNHRKLVVIDGVIGYTGSQNMIEASYHRKDAISYDELVVRLEGPVVVQMEAIFFADWVAETGETPPKRSIAYDSHQLDRRALAQMLPSGPGYTDENNLKTFTAMMYAAERTITIVNPYFVPSEALLVAVVSAARRGVKVTIVNSLAMDQWMVGHAQRSYYEELLEAGVEILLYKPRFLHSKFMVIDDEIAAVGSSNMDIRSFELNHELTLLSYDKRFAHDLSQIATHYIRQSKRVAVRSWLARHWYKKLLDNLARLTSSLQ